jgi:hypothetical protein
MRSGNRFPVILPLFAVLILTVVGFRYNEYVIHRNFVMDVNAPCDPSTEACFTSSCSPAEDLGCPVGPYKKIEINNADAPRCLENHQCTHFACDGIASCTTTYCSSDVLADGESCTEKPQAETVTASTTTDKKSP